MHIGKNAHFVYFQSLKTSDILKIDSQEEFHSKEIFKYYQNTLIPVMQSAVKLAKRVPGFTSLPLNDQIALMKQGTLSVAIMMVKSYFMEKQ